MREVIARKKHKCRYCKEVIKKDEICVQGGKRFYHKKCHFEKWQWLGDEPKISETVRRRKILKWYLEEQLKQQN